MKRILIIVVTFFTVMSFAQTQQQKPSELVAQQKTLGAEFQKVQIFSPASQQKNSIQTPKGLDDYMLFSVDQRAMKSMQGGYPATMNLEIPGQKSALSVDLVKVTITTDDFQAIDMPSGRVLPRDNTAHYRGVVKGKSNSLVAISFFDNKIAGFISIDGEKDNLVVGPVKTTENHILYRDGQMSYLYELACDVEDDLEGYTKEELAAPQSRAATKCPRIFFDIGTDVVNDKGGSQQASNYVEALFNQAAALYANDQIFIKLSGTKAWASNQPFSSDLNSYINYKNRTGLNGDLGHYVTYGYGGGQAGGIGTLCNSSRKYAISGIEGSYVNIPTYSFDVFLISHEMGHNLGSRHTHACVWNGNNTAIDGCAGSVEGSCSLPGNPAGGGTIMSYCPKVSVGVNFNKGFGPQPSNVIRNYIAGSSCLQTCGGGGGCSSGDSVSVTFSNNTDCTLQYYNNNSLQGSANAGQSFTANTTVGSIWQARQASGATVDDFTIICDQTTYASSGTCGGGGGSCSGLPQYAAGTSYNRNQEVQNIGEKFTCDVPGWCSSSVGWAYAPGTGTYWQYAWSKTGTCSRASITFKEDESASGLNFTIYPNPVRDQLNIEFNNLKSSSSISIKNMNGRILETDQLKALSKGATVKKSMDVSDLPKGIYFVQITIGSKVVTQKIFIE
ncbi:T9SS type A sorting domain-containing protein [Aquimarina sp. I32.4]|uniref:T9SS type A sorting domain-containing protein n=1 Tax=Aquimarina sp. I32.4 TaxID=2053903 RepID=UPI000CDEEB0C|nr:T9SS type A sorting domain-containing protein [Aquimarina sp. I32.4]